MAKPLSSPEHILPLRFTLRVHPDAANRFSILSFPFEKAMRNFMSRFKAVYQHEQGQDLPNRLQLPYRQLNDALLALAPGLVHGFEYLNGAYRMVAFTHMDDKGHPVDFPTLAQLTDLIRFWLERWAAHPEIEPLIKGHGQAAWQELLQTLRGEPETEWEHNKSLEDIEAASELKGLLFATQPALLSALLHGRQMTIHRPQNGDLTITWRRAHDGGKNGLHLVSQPIPVKHHFFAYRLDFSKQTQAGYDGSWIFARLGIQRYISQRYRERSDKRSVSILVGHNRNQFSGGWDTDTALIRLPVTCTNDQWKWKRGVGELLDDFAVRKLEQPAAILASPERYGNYDGVASGDDHYIVFAEGREFGAEETGRKQKHKVKTGVGLYERGQIMAGVLSLLDGWLEESPPFTKDAQKPLKLLAARDHDYMVKRNKMTPQKQASWRAGLLTSLAHSGAHHVHLIVLHRTPEFCRWAQAQVLQTAMGMDEGGDPLMSVSYVPLPPSLYKPLAVSDPEMPYRQGSEKPRGWENDWKRQIREGYANKREEWCDFLSRLGWKASARRLLLIDSTGESGVRADRQIKGAIRDACHRNDVLSQFIIGDRLELDKKNSNKLDGESRGRLKNALIDLVVRQQGLQYGPPRDIYTVAAQMDADTASELDVIAFCRIKRTIFPSLCYVLAIRLRATGEVDVLLPEEPAHWIPYDMAAHKLGILYSDHRVQAANSRGAARIDFGNRQMLEFAHRVLKEHLERPTIAVIEAAGWRNSSGGNDTTHCWTQLVNPRLASTKNVLHFDNQRRYERSAPSLDLLLGVVRLRMHSETPQYVTADQLEQETPRDLSHLTGYVDPAVPDLLHYFSVARLSNMQKVQKEERLWTAFRMDEHQKARHDIAIKHPQLIEMVPFFVHPRFQSDEGQRQLCRCVHFLRSSPSFTSGETTLPYPMHLGEKLIRDQLVILGAQD